MCLCVCLCVCELPFKVLLCKSGHKKDRGLRHETSSSFEHWHGGCPCKCLVQEERHSVGLISIGALTLEKFELFPDPPAKENAFLMLLSVHKPVLRHYSECTI